MTFTRRATRQLLLAAPIVTPPDPGTLLEGRIPYERIVRTFAWQDSTLNNNALPKYFSPFTTWSDEVIPSYLIGKNPTPSQWFTFPRGQFLDSIDCHDGNGAATPGQEVKIYVKEWGQAEYQLTIFSGSFYQQVQHYPLPGRIEVEWVRFYSPTPANIYPVRLAFHGAYTSTLKPTFAPRRGKLANMAGMNTYDFNVNAGSNYKDYLKKWSIIRFYGENNEMLFDSDKPRFAPSWRPNWDETLKKPKDSGQQVVFVLNGNSQANTQSFVDNWTNPDPDNYDTYDIGRNAYYQYGKDRLDPLTYRWLGKLAFALMQRYGTQTWDPADIDIEQTIRNNINGDPIQPKLSGLGYIDWLMIGNELFKDWKLEPGHHSVQIAALMLAVAWDGCNGLVVDEQGRLRVGAKYADPTTKIGIGIPYNTDPGIILELDYWLGEIYGRDANGNSLWFPHMCEGHDYLRKPSNGEGIAFEQSDCYEATQACIEVLQRKHPLTEYMQSEDGYTSDPRAYGNALDGAFTNYSYVIAKNGLSAPARRWAFTLGGMGFKSSLGLAWNILYDDFNHDAPGDIKPQHPWDRVCGYCDTFSQAACWSMLPLIDGYTVKSFDPARGNDKAFVLILEKSGAPDIYMIWAPEGVVTPVNVGTGTLHAFDATTGVLTDLGSNNGDNIIPTELPVFLVAA